MDENNNEYQVSIEKIAGTEVDGECEYTYTISRDSEALSTGTFTAESEATEEELKAIALDEFSASGELVDDDSSDESSDNSNESELSSIEDDSTGTQN